MLRYTNATLCFAVVPLTLASTGCRCHSAVLLLWNSLLWRFCGLYISSLLPPLLIMIQFDALFAIFLSRLWLPRLLLLRLKCAWRQHLLSLRCFYCCRRSFCCALLLFHYNSFYYYCNIFINTLLLICP